MKKAKILLVDDEEIVLVGWQEELTLAGYEVKIASSGIQAVEAARKDKPDIVITDLVMPEMNGVEVCGKIKELYSDLEVVFVSGHPREIEMHLMDFLSAGGRDEFLRKPIFENEMVKVIEKIMKERR